MKDLNQKLKNLPNSSGIYFMKNAQGKILYIGKAKNLKNRVRSYFRKNQDLKTRFLVEKIEDIDIFETRNEIEAFILESQQIQAYQPMYNIQLKDNRSYPLLAISKSDPFPRLSLLRSRELSSEQEVYGPFRSSNIVFSLLFIAEEFFALRTCRHKIPFPLNKKLPNVPCIRFSLQKCFAPCLGKQSPEDYQKNLKEFKAFLEKKTKQKAFLKKIDKLHFTSQNHKLSASREELLQALEALSETQKILLLNNIDVDIITSSQTETHIFFLALSFKKGQLISKSHSSSIKKESFEESVFDFLGQNYLSLQNSPFKILFDFEIENVSFLEEIFKNLLGFKPQILKNSKSWNDVLSLARQNLMFEMEQFKDERGS